MPKKKAPKKTLGKKALKAAKGGHSGGVMVGLGDGSVRMADGSVRFISPPVN